MKTKKKAVKAVEKAVRKAVHKGVTEGAVEDAVEHSIDWSRSRIWMSMLPLTVRPNTGARPRSRAFCWVSGHFALISLGAMSVS
jgi:hypothetical protein